jgi:hypothetical protein
MLIGVFDSRRYHERPGLQVHNLCAWCKRVLAHKRHMNLQVVTSLLGGKDVPPSDKSGGNKDDKKKDKDEDSGGWAEKCVKLALHVHRVLAACASQCTNHITS